MAWIYFGTSSRELPAATPFAQRGPAARSKPRPGKRVARVLLLGAPLGALGDPGSGTSIFRPASSNALAIDLLSPLVLAITGASSSSSSDDPLRHRALPPAGRTTTRREPPQVYGSKQIELAWTVIPILIVVVLFLATARVIHAIAGRAAAAGRPRRHRRSATSGGGSSAIRSWGSSPPTSCTCRSAIRAHPTPTYLTLLSADTDHSFWVPRLAGKTDLIPNRVNQHVDRPARGRPLPRPVRRVLRHPARQDAAARRRATRARTSSAGSARSSSRAVAGPTASPRAGSVFETTACVNCHTVRGHRRATARFGPDLTHLMSRDTLAAGAAPNTPENLRRWIQDPDAHQAGLPDAGHAAERRASSTRSSRYLLTLALERDGWRAAMSSDADRRSRRRSASTPRRGSRRCTTGSTTVDHKRIGLHVHRLRARVPRRSAASKPRSCASSWRVRNNHFVSPQVFNQLFTMHGTTMVFFVGMPILFGFGELPGAADDRRARHGVPAAERLGFWMTLFGGLLLYFSFSAASGLYGAGSAPDVGWFAYAPLTAQAFSRGHSTDYWIARPARQRHRQHRHRRQHRRPPSSACAARA